MAWDTIGQSNLVRALRPGFCTMQVPKRTCLRQPASWSISLPRQGVSQVQDCFLNVSSERPNLIGTCLGDGRVDVNLNSRLARALSKTIDAPTEEPLPAYTAQPTLPWQTFTGRPTSTRTTMNSFLLPLHQTDDRQVSRKKASHLIRPLSIRILWPPTWSGCWTLTAVGICPWTRRVWSRLSRRSTATILFTRVLGVRMSEPRRFGMCLRPDFSKPARPWWIRVAHRLGCL